ncbi:MAG: prolyl oligopeptidase family serine peptidase, partial [Gemmatimonadota bacterium]
MEPRTRGLLALSLSFAVLVCGSWGSEPAAAQSPRTLTPDDVVNISTIGSSTLSPDGEWLAVEVRRPPTSPSRFRGPATRGERSDIWLVSPRTGETRNLTGGQSDSTGAFAPLWSPDGDRLAFLSTRGRDDRLHLFIWDRTNDRTRSPTSQGVLEGASFTIGPESSRGFAWLDDQSVLFVSPPSGYGRTTMDIAPGEWQKARLGEEATVSVLESGSAVTDRDRPGSKLLRLDVSSEESLTLAEVPPEDPLQSVAVTAPAEGAGTLMVQADLGPHAPPLSVPLSGSLARLTRIAIISSREPGTPEWMEEVPGASSRVEWLPDGSVAIARGRVSDDETESRLFLVTPGTDSVRTLATDSLEISSARWTPSRDLLVFAKPTSASQAPEPSEPDTTAVDSLQAAADSVAADSVKRANRSNWWLLSQDLSRARNLTAELEEVPGSLRPMLDGATLVGLADSTLWMVDTGTETASPLPTPSLPKLSSIVWPSASPAGPPYSSELIVQTGEGAERKLYRVELTGEGAEIRDFPQPTPQASLRAFEPERSVAVFQATERTGSYLWLGDGESSEFEAAITLNSSLAEIADARRMLIEYRGVDGDSLEGVLLLPPDYEEGERYPMLTWVYAGSTFEDTLSFSFEKGSGSALNPQLFTAKGYAVLFPSMPLEGNGVASDPYIDLPKGVMAAVDKAIDLGIADPDRLAVAGHSYGGYSTYTLVSYTNRFKAAIAMDGDANLLTSYAKFDADQRYWDNAQEQREGATWSEASQGRMGEPPWDGLWRYLRNSPFFYLDRIDTPLMIIQSDMDFVPIIHAEEMFSGLYRLGKTARFVRYW